MTKNNLFYISRNYRFSKNAASKPKMDCETILSSMGVKNLGFPQSNHPSSALGAVISFFSILTGLLRLPFSSTLCMQYPLSKFFHLKTTIAKLKNCKIIMIVHDVKTLMGKNKNVEKEMKRFNKADVLILHNQAMISWFSENGYKGKMVPLYLFDYLLAPGQELPDMPTGFEQNLVFAGGLGMEKSAFLYKLDKSKKFNFRLRLYGNGFQKNLTEKDSMLEYQGSFAPDEVLNHIKGNFGLAWNGTSIQECDGSFGKYTRYNNPHKISLYLLAGLPVIIWRQAAMTPFIEKEGIGFGIDSLEDLPGQLAQMDEDTFNKMIANVQRIRKQIIKGHFLQTAMNTALEQLD